MRESPTHRWHESSPTYDLPYDLPCEDEVRERRHHDRHYPTKNHHHNHNSNYSYVPRRRHRTTSDPDYNYDSDDDDRRRSRRSAIPFESRVLNPYLNSYNYVPARHQRSSSDSARATDHETLDCPCAGCRSYTSSNRRGRAQSRDPDRKRNSSRSRHRGRSRGDQDWASDTESPRFEKSRHRAKSRDRDDSSVEWTPDQGMALVALPRAATSLGRRYAGSPSASLTRNRLSYPPSSTAYPRYGLSTSAARGSANATASASAGHLAFHIAASFVGKGVRYDPVAHTVELSRLSKPYFPSLSSVSRSNRIQSGHDSFFITSRAGSEDGTVAVGVADGVGGWVTSGVDPGDFSHALCANMAESAAGADSKKHVAAKNVMLEGYTRTCHDPNLRAGGSTACVAIASPTTGLDVANLGDSGYVVLRARAVHTASQAQTHAFNTPYQLALVPPHIITRAATYGGKHHIDMPSDADVTHVSLRRGDVVVLATDGVWDNLFVQDVLQIANRVMKRRGAWEQSDDGVLVAENLESLVSSAEDESLQYDLATELVASAKTVSHSKTLVTPFAKSVKRHYPNEPWNGGKVDDICVVVMVVTDALDVRSRL